MNTKIEIWMGQKWLGIRLMNLVSVKMYGTSFTVKFL